MPALELTPKRRKKLREMAHALNPVVQVGNDGVTDGVIKATDRALLDHELIKVRMREPEDKKGMANALAERTASGLCGLIGHTVILYRPHPDKPQIKI